MKIILYTLLLVPNLLLASELECMAKNLYFEARGEAEAGQFLVGFVTMNRVRDKRWPDTICKVIYQRNQFEWTRDKHSDNPKDRKLYNRMIYIASIVMQADNVDQYGYYFKATHRKSSFFKKLTKLMVVDNHEFYK